MAILSVAFLGGLLGDGVTTSTRDTETHQNIGVLLLAGMELSYTII